MAIKVAFASSDGTSVDAHFGRAENFFVYAVLPDSYEYLEKRSCEPQEPSEFSLKPRALALQDCTLIIAQKFGRHAWAVFDPALVELLELEGNILHMLPQLQKLVRLRRKYHS